MSGCPRRLRAGGGGPPAGSVRGWPRRRRVEPRARPPARAPAQVLQPGPRRRRCGGAGTRGADRPRSSSSTTSPWTGGPQAWARSARSRRHRRRRPPRPGSRRRRRRPRGPRPRPPPRPALPEPGTGPRRPRACSARRPRPPASAWTRSATGEWGGRGCGDPLTWGRQSGVGPAAPCTGFGGRGHPASPAHDARSGRRR